MSGGLVRADQGKHDIGALRVFVCCDEEIESGAQALELAQHMSKGFTGSRTVDF